MIKEPRSINKQIEFLEKKYCEREAQNEDMNNIRPSQLGKSIIRGTEENQKIEKFLMLNSYDNVITPLKPIISTGYKIGESRSWHKYDNETSWQEIIALNEKINEIENRLLRSVLSFEMLLKTTLTETIKDLISNPKNNLNSFKEFLDEIEPFEKKGIEKIIEDFKEGAEKMDKESGYKRNWRDVWWYHIKSLSLGKFNTLLTATYKGKTLYEYNMARLRPELNKISYGLITYWLSYEKKEMLPRKGVIKELLDNFRILRNSLCHNTPLLIFLDRPLKGKEFLEKELKDTEEYKKEQIKRDITKKSLQHRDRKSIINAMIKYNNAVFTQHKIELSSNGIILNYEVYRNTKLYRETKNKYENIENMV